MKKYIIPAIKIADIENETILDTSTFDPNTAPGYSSGSLGARKRDLFDDFDDFDDYEDEDF